MARPRTPTKLLDARGAFKKDPQRKRHGEPEVRDPLGSPPDWLTEFQLVEWREIVHRAPLGVLTAADWHSVAIASVLYAEFKTDAASMPVARITTLEKLLGKFGMSPSDRAKLSIEKPKDANPFAAFD